MKTPNVKLEKLIEFVNKKPRIRPDDYGGNRSAYDADCYIVTKALSDFKDLLAFARRVASDEGFEAYVNANKGYGRLSWDEAQQCWDYCTVQYFPTEYRAAACSLLARVIWSAMRDDYETTGALRARLKKALRRSIIQTYF